MPDETIPAKRSKRDRFVEVASRRTRNIIRDIRRLANCANRSAYTYEPADVLKIFTTIEQELAVAKTRFEAIERKKEVSFSIDG